MKFLNVLLFVGLLLCWTELSAASMKRRVKPGICPPDYVRCFRAEPDECGMDYHCSGRQKCCYSHCARRCVNPIQVQPGMCPPDEIVCIQRGRDECKRDFECRGEQKCCYNACAMRCIDAVPV